MWYGGIIPEEEIWLKIGGDKGGGTFKMSFQIANVENPANTCVFAIYEGPYTVVNLHDIYKQVEDAKCFTSQ